MKPENFRQHVRLAVELAVSDHGWEAVRLYVEKEKSGNPSVGCLNRLLECCDGYAQNLVRANSEGLPDHMVGRAVRLAYDQIVGGNGVLLDLVDSMGLFR